MISPFDYFTHRFACKRKQEERARRIADLPPAYLRPTTSADRSILTKDIQDLVQDVHNEITNPIDILRAYGKTAVRAHKRTNCLTEIAFPGPAESFINDGDVDLEGPLTGIPVSVKDTVNIDEFDTSVGYSRYTSCPKSEDGAMIKLLKQAGAVPFVKTNLPVTLLSFESTNDVWGQCKNPHNHKYSPGGSTGGEAALLASGGSRIGIGTDVAGSVRVPAHYSGCYSLRCSTGRWPKSGGSTSMAGQEGVLAVLSPMARTLNDLTYFTRSIIQLQPWRLDHSVHPLKWRTEMENEIAEAKQLRIGVMHNDGVVAPSPACSRALEEASMALQRDGHIVFDLELSDEQHAYAHSGKVDKPFDSKVPARMPSPYEGLQLASLLLNSDGCRTFLSHFRTGESSDPGAAQLSFYMRLPRFMKYLWYCWVKYVKRDHIWAGLLYDWHAKSAADQWKLVAKREDYRARWIKYWNSLNLDLLLTVPNATPAVPHGGMKDAVSNCNYTFLWNLLDYSAGVLPVTHVDPLHDQLPPTFPPLKRLNGVARGAYKHYDARAMAGLPVGVQLVAGRLQEEKVIAGMKRVEDALAKHSLTGPYRLMEVD
ncbi:MAG: hypothetical protein M1831_006540 [Alyxoria varia]|nr:MAG: hypothetical protein M1831_006540 [Alyxoria varia]